MTAFSLCVHLRLDANSTLALSLPQSRLCILWARQLCPLAVLRSCFGYSLSHLRTAAACLSRCIRHRRRSKAKPLRGSRGGSAAGHGFSFAVKVQRRRYTLSGDTTPQSRLRRDSSPYTGEPRSALSSPCRGQGGRDSRSVCLCAYSAFRFSHSALFCAEAL